MELKRAPLRVRYIEKEPAYSLFGRLAARNFYDSCRTFARDHGLKYDEGILVGRMLDEIAIMSGIDAEVLRKDTIVYQDGKFRINGHDIETRYWSAAKRRVCPECLKQDFRSASKVQGPVALQPYLRMWWDVTIVEACPIHLTMLLQDCPRCTKPLSCDAPLAWQCKCGFDLSTHRSPRMDATDCLSDRYIVGRLGGCVPLPVFVLDALPLTIATLAIQHIGRAELHGRNYWKFSSAESDTIEARRAGLKVLRSWPKAFYNLLDKLAAQRDPSREGKRAGMAGMYGDLYLWLYRSSHTELDVFRGAIKRHAERRLTTNAASLAFGGRLNTRTITLGTVMDRWGIKSLEKIHLIATHLGYADAGQPVLRSLPIPQDGLDRIRAMMLDQISTTAAASYLNIVRRHLKELIDRNIISCVPIQSQGKTKKLLFKSTLDAFRAHLFGASYEIEAAPEGVVTIEQASRMTSLSYVDIVQGILDGRVQAVGRVPKVAGVRSLLVPVAQVSKLKNPDPPRTRPSTAAPLLQDLGRRITRQAPVSSEGSSPAMTRAQRVRNTSSLASDRGEGHRRPVLEPHEDVLRSLVAEKPSITLAEIQTELESRGIIVVSQTTILFALRRLGLRHKKRRLRGRA